MKRLALIVALFIVVLLIAACGGTAPSAEAPAAEAPQESAEASSGPQYGGEATVVYKDDLATLDPAVGYDWTNWPTIKMVFDGLLDYDDSTNLVPRLAESRPEIRYVVNSTRRTPMPARYAASSSSPTA